MEETNILSYGERLRLVEALQTIRCKVSWKPSKDVIHLEKRKRMRHLEPVASMRSYEHIIFDIVRNATNVVYLYEFGGVHYYAVRGHLRNREWLVLFGEGGLIETAFPPEDMDEYLMHRGFVFLGHVEEVLRWTQKPAS